MSMGKIFANKMFSTPNWYLSSAYSWTFDDDDDDDIYVFAN